MQRFIRPVSALLLVLGVGIFVFGVSQWGAGSDLPAGLVGPGPLGWSAGWPKDAEYAMSIGAMLSTAGVLGLRYR